MPGIATIEIPKGWHSGQSADIQEAQYYIVNSPPIVSCIFISYYHLAISYSYEKGTTYIIRWFNDCIAVDMVILVIFHSKLTNLRLCNTHSQHTPWVFHPTGEIMWNPTSHFLLNPLGNGPMMSPSSKLALELLHLAEVGEGPPSPAEIRSSRIPKRGSATPQIDHDSHDMPGPYGPMGLKPSNYMKLWHFKSGLWHCSTGPCELLYRENPSKPLEPSGKYTKMAEWVYAKMARWVYNTSGFERLENRTHKMVQWVYN